MMKKKPKYRLAMLAGAFALAFALWPHQRGGFVLAQINTPTLADGPYLSPRDAPCIPFVLGPSTGTAEAAVRTTGPGYLSWVYLSTGAVDAYVLLRDSSPTAANALSGFEVYHGADVSGGAATSAKMIRFDPPMRFANGLTATKSVAATKVAVCTRLYGTQVP